MRKLKKKTNTLKVCVFCGSRNGQHGEFKVLTMKLGRLIASEGWHLIYGGGKTGLMGTLSKTIKDFNGSITSVIPEIFNKEKKNGSLTIKFKDLDQLEYIMKKFK